MDRILWGGKEIDVLTSIPKGWQIIQGATTHPKGYKWISNGKSLFSKERQIALIKD